jgi:hypothetical protein
VGLAGGGGLGGFDEFGIHRRAVDIRPPCRRWRHSRWTLVSVRIMRIDHPPYPGNQEQ